MTTISTPAAATTTRQRSGSAPLRVTAAGLAASAATIAVLLATEPWGDRLDSSADDVLDYDKLLEVRDAAWAAMLVDGFAYAVVALTLSIGVLHLARSRGGVAALVGAVLTAAGGILFAMGAGASSSRWAPGGSRRSRGSRPRQACRRVRAGPWSTTPTTTSAT